MYNFYSKETINSIDNESDVEQKFVYPWLLDVSGFGLSILSEFILTKRNILEFDIEKGSSHKRYYPDYLVVINQIPVMVIEAKAPNVDVQKGFTEAQMYAHKINSFYGHNLNPIQHVISINGLELWYGKSDVGAPEIKVDITNENFHLSPEFNLLNSKIDYDQLKIETDKLNSKIKGNSKYIKPSFQLGAKNRREAKVSENSFGSNLALIYKGDFNPETKIERENIAKNAYVESKRREKHINHIERIITRNSDKFNNSHSIASDNKKVIINTITDENYKNQICLLIGGVGSGKSTFTDYLRYNKLDYDKSTFWMNINLNNCPPDKSLIFPWLIEQIDSGIREEYPKINFDEISFIEKIFSSEIASFKTGSISLFSPTENEYKVRYAKKIDELNEDKNNKIRKTIDYLFVKKEIAPILVLDNCDKRDKERQLLMFEVANWLKNEFQCNILLPIRDTTYDVYKDEPPLDTVVKDLTFRIDPPLLQKVIENRLKYIKFRNTHKFNEFKYLLANGVQVNVKKDEIDTYLKSIVNSIFQDKFFRTIIIGLAGKNIRKGIEIILDFCKSGYLKEDFILKIRTNEEQKIPAYLVSQILLKGNRLYYSDEDSIVKNLFHSYVENNLPDPFIRLTVLLYLKENFKLVGGSGSKGFVKVEDILKAMTILGHNREDTLLEMQTLLQSDCIVSESSLKYIDLDDYLKLSSSGFVHIDMLKNVNYLSAVAEDTYFRDLETANNIASNMTGVSVFSSNSYSQNLNSSKLLLEYLLKFKKEFYSKPLAIYLDDDITEEKLNECIQFVESKIGRDSSYDELALIGELYKEGTLKLATVTGIKPDCIFVEFDTFTGYIKRKDNLIFNEYIEDVLENGDLITVEIIGYNTKHKKFDVKIDSVD